MLALWTITRLLYAILRSIPLSTIQYVAFGFQQPYIKCLLMCILSNVGSALSTVEIQRISPPTATVITKFCAKHKLPVKSVKLECEPSATLHFTEGGTSSSKPLLLYFHGGGYVNPASSAQPPFLLACAQAAGMELAIIEYTLAPDGPYPTQLVQAVAALRYALQYRNAAEIVLAGDSAGGHLALSLLAHIKQSSPYAPPVDLNGQKFRGALLLSPWVTLEYSARSYKANERCDFLNRDRMLEFTRLWKPKNELWADPASASEGFWQDIPVQKTLLTAGEWEVFRDDVIAFAGTMGAEKRIGAKTRLAVCARGVHVDCVIDHALKLEGEMKYTALRWMQEI